MRYKYNETNREILAEKVVDCMDMKGLVSFAIDKLVKEYEKDEEAFKEDWNNIMK